MSILRGMCLLKNWLLGRYSVSKFLREEWQPSGVGVGVDGLGGRRIARKKIISSKKTRRLKFPSNESVCASSAQS